MRQKTSPVHVAIERDKEGKIWIFMEAKLLNALPAESTVKIGVLLEELFPFIRKTLNTEVSYVA